MTLVSAYSQIVMSDGLTDETIIQDCVGSKCELRTIQIIPHNKLYKRRPSSISAQGEKEFKRQYQMRFEDYQIGQCYIDVNKPESYFYVTKVVPSDLMVWFAEEKEDDPFWLNQRYFFYNNREFVRGHRIIPCERSPNLGRVGYVKDCIDRAATGNYACDDERLR